jgi:hypothetical protein
MRPKVLLEIRLPTHLVVWLEGIGGRNLISTGNVRADHLTSLVLALVLVELIDVDLEVLGGLGETKGIEAAVT